MKIAWFSPLSRKSAIGQFSSIVIPELARKHNVVAFAADVADPQESWLPQFGVRVFGDKAPISDAEIRAFDAIVYNMGDYLPFHAELYEVSLRHPGLVILHDLVMHHFFAEYFHRRTRDPAGFDFLLAWCHGDAGRRLAERIRSGERIPDRWSGETMLRLHMAKAAVRGGYGAIVHSRFAAENLKELAAIPVRAFAFPRPLAADRGAEARGPRRADGPVRLLTHGTLNRNKQADLVLRILGRNDSLRTAVHYDITGDDLPGDPYGAELRNLRSELGLEGVVDFRGYLDDEALHNALRDSDIVLVIRNPHFGESSWTLLEALFLGRATIVWRHGFYDELPDDVVVKVDSAESLEQALLRLIGSAETRQEIGARAAAYAKDHFRTSRYAENLVAFVEEARHARPVLNLGGEMAENLSDFGCDIDEENSMFEPVADELINLVRGRLEGGIRSERPRESPWKVVEIRRLQEETAGLRASLEQTRDQLSEASAERDRLLAFHQAVTGSTVWKVLQAARRIVGRAW